MAHLVAQSKLNASTINILNVIRANAPSDYRDKVPKVNNVDDIVKVGEIIYGNTGFQNDFISALVNRIAFELINSATFNNPYKLLKKGVIDYGEIIEDVFVGIAKVVDYDPSKAESREFARTFPDVKSAFYKINWRVMYPVTVEKQELYLAFQSEAGLTNLITKIINSIMVAYEYDEFLLFKYQLIKAIAHGKMYPVAVDGSDLKNYASAFKSYRNKTKFMKTDFNEAGVMNNTEDSKLSIFIDSDFDAQFDVNVLASAFNMDKADFVGRRFLIDDWTTFDNKRWTEIRENTISELKGDTSGVIEVVTDEELAIMAKVKAVMIDSDWFQIYESVNEMDETKVGSGLYWNYFYHNWKVVAHSPFSNAIVFVDNSATIAVPDSFTATVTDVSTVSDVSVYNLIVDDSTASLQPSDIDYVQTEDLTEAGVGVQTYGSYLVPKTALEGSYDLEASIKGVNFVTATAVAFTGLEAGTTITFQKES